MKLFTFKSRATLLLLSVFAANLLFSQQKNIDYSNVREGEHVEYCKTHKKMHELQQNPAFAQQFVLDQELLKNSQESEGNRTLS